MGKKWDRLEGDRMGVLWTLKLKMLCVLKTWIALDIYLREMKTCIQINTRTQIFILSLFIIVKK